MYRELLGEMIKKGITRKEVAKLLGITPKTFFNKMNGRTEFTWTEVKAIRQMVAPEKTLDDLFKESETQQVS